MAIKGQILGVDKLQKQLSSLPPNVSDNVQIAMLRIVTEMDKDVKGVISKGGRSGRVYKRGKKAHQASAKGEPPKTDRGGLISGFNFEVNRVAGRVIGILRNISSHAAPLEFKPVNKGGRPFMRPLYHRWEKRIKEALGNAAKVGVRSVKK